MATISRNFESNVAATQLTSIDSTEQFFDVIPDLSAHEGCVVTIDFNPVVSPTDNLVVSCYNQTDGTNYDDTPFYQFEIDKGTDPNQVSFVVTGMYKFRVGVKSAGATDTHTSADMDSRRWNYTSA